MQARFRQKAALVLSEKRKCPIYRQIVAEHQFGHVLFVVH